MDRFANSSRARADVGALACGRLLKRVVDGAWDLPMGVTHLLPVALDVLDAWPEEPRLAWCSHQPRRMTNEDELADTSEGT